MMLLLSILALSQLSQLTLGFPTVWDSRASWSLTDQKKRIRFTLLDIRGSRFHESSGFQSNRDGDDSDGEYEDDDYDQSGLLSLLDTTGQALKPAAEKASAKSVFVEGKWHTFRYLAQACLLFSLFILFRGLRSFFVILPAVFRHTYRKLETVIDMDPFEVHNKNDSNMVFFAKSSSSSTDKKHPRSLQWRTTITLTILAATVTLSYALGGLLRVLGTAVRSGGGSLTKSFENAAAAQERHENTLFRRVQERDINGRRH